MGKRIVIAARALVILFCSLVLTSLDSRTKTIVIEEKEPIIFVVTPVTS